MSTDLDTRARSAAVALRRAATGLDLPASPPQRQRRSGPPGRWIAVGAAVAVLVSAVVSVVAGSGGDASRPATSASGGTPILIPEPAPDGLEPTGAVELPLAGADRGPERLTVRVFGDPSAIDPVASATLGITVFRSDAAVPVEAGRELTVRGRAAWVATDGAGRTALSWQEAPGVLVVVSSATLAEADLAAVADELAFSEDHASFDVPILPAGLGPVGTMTDAGLTGALAPAVVPDATSGHLVGYQDPGDGRVLIVATLGLDHGEAAVLQWMLGRPLGDVEVRGHSGRLSAQDAETPDRAALHTVVWEETPGVYAMVSGSVDEATLLTAAESLRPATDQEWTDLASLGGEVSPH